MWIFGNVTSFIRKFIVDFILETFNYLFKNAYKRMSCATWGYKPENGPNTWCNHFPQANGKNQSPVDIRPTKELSNKAEMCLTWKYQPECAEVLKNTGSSWKVECNGRATELRGGPLEGVYKLEQFHCHWGKDNSQGSEHTVNGISYAGELHFVHKNTKYATCEQAANEQDGFCVVGVFLKAGQQNDELEKLTSQMKKITYKGEKVTLNESVDITKFFPDKSGYYTYYGSLTTPPCSECVIWAVFQKPIEVSEEQLDAFRKLKYVTKEEEVENEEAGYMHENFRPTNPLGERTIIKYTN